MSQLGQYISLNALTPVDTVTGNSGGAVSPDAAGNLNIIGSGTITVAGNPGTNTLTISNSGAVAILFTEDVGSATPAAGNLNILGTSAQGISTSGAGSTVTITAANATTAQKGVVALATNAEAIAGTDTAKAITADDLKAKLGTQTNHGVLVGAGTAAAVTALSVGTNGQVLIGSTAADPVFGTLTSSDSSISFTTGAGTLSLQVAGGTTVGKTITGNSGGALSPTAGNWNIVTSNSTPKFVGAGSTLTLDFSLTNLMLGSNGSTITIGEKNTAMGFLVSSAVTSGVENCMYGFEAMFNATTSSSCVSIGAYSMLLATIGANNNTAVGHSALQAIATGTGNIALGYNAGGSLTLANSNNISIGSTAVAGESARIRIGTNATHTSAFIAGIDGVNVGSVAKVVTMASDQLGTATVTAGAGISVTPGANTITISSTGGGAAWSVITANQTAAIQNGYFCNKAGTLALALPAASAVGDVIEVTNENTALGVQFTQAAGQQILIANTNTTLGATGTLTSSAVGDTLKIVCYVANTIWRATNIVGNWSPV